MEIPDVSNVLGPDLGYELGREKEQLSYYLDQIKCFRKVDLKVFALKMIFQATNC